jgi:hypothetical protein
VGTAAFQRCVCREEDSIGSVSLTRCSARNKKCGDIREEVDAAAKYRHPREEERNA